MGAASSHACHVKPSLAGMQRVSQGAASSLAQVVPSCPAPPQAAQCASRKVGRRVNVIFATLLFAREHGHCMPLTADSLAARRTGACSAGSHLQHAPCNALVPLSSGLHLAVQTTRSTRCPSVPAGPLSTVMSSRVGCDRLEALPERRTEATHWQVSQAIDCWRQCARTVSVAYSSIVTLCLCDADLMQCESFASIDSTIVRSMRDTHVAPAAAYYVVVSSASRCRSRLDRADAALDARHSHCHSTALQQWSTMGDTALLESNLHQAASVHRFDVRSPAFSIRRVVVSSLGVDRQSAAAEPPHEGTLQLPLEIYRCLPAPTRTSRAQESSSRTLAPRDVDGCACVRLLDQAVVRDVAAPVQQQPTLRPDVALSRGGAAALSPLARLIRGRR